MARQINSRGGKKDPNKTIKNVTMYRGGGVIGTQTNYTDGTGYWNEQRGKSVSGIRSKSGSGTGKQVKKTRK